MKIPPDADGWDWNLTNQQLGRKHNRLAKTIANIRLVLGKAPARNANQLYQVDWTEMDWSKSTETIQSEVGCAKSTVSKYRRIHAPHTLSLSAGKGSPSAENHPNYTHGRYVGAKKKLRNKTLRTGATEAGKRWLILNVAIRRRVLAAKFLDGLQNEGFSRRKAIHATINLKRTGYIETVTNSGHPSDSEYLRLK